MEGADALVSALHRNKTSALLSALPYRFYFTVTLFAKFLGLSGS